MENLEYYRLNAEEDYFTTPISVLAYISHLEAALQIVVGPMKQLSLGEDVNGREIFPNDTVLIEGLKNSPTKIELGRFREKFNSGCVFGWYVPDYCKKYKYGNKHIVLPFCFYLYNTIC